MKIKLFDQKARACNLPSVISYNFNRLRRMWDAASSLPAKTVQSLLLKRSFGRRHHSLVGFEIHALLPGEAVHATDDPGVHLRPALVADLPPLASVFHLQKAVGDRNPFPVRVRGSDPHVFHLHRQALENSGGDQHGIFL